ncbi:MULTISPECIES: helix-turn-helix domain-containing protein [Alphaproteobacteria]|uniref:AraC family transcriptional regulator n=2 Tax=Alphaproteobacteria TaxID=28211 RepID=A0A512HH86_9HYPH|nr:MULTISPECIES: helix-turn-helix domain-containing protein [Alphaproteobacteria]GEO84806.1 AraC family transcriptional regulator [Ciceribacter naphthalenivorans]GLR20573.1 AraC family transcriptional regulator [Ciceribacter naphthalenivorans]GLT03429.1 AraC family transcriptional regulator [Sphingomonas psychrolutea]
MSGETTASIPHYYLYGDQGEDIELDFLNIEIIRERSGPNDWRIRPHAHPDHMQILLVRDGGGTIRMEAQPLTIPAPGILVIPAGIVHKIDFDPGTDGFVITAAVGCLKAASMSDSRLTDAANRPAVYPLEGTGVNIAAAVDTFYWLHREYVWSAPGRRTAIMAQFMRVLVMVLRLSITQDDPRIIAPDRDYDLLARYRSLFEDHFRVERSPAFYADALAVTPARLNAACKNRAGKTASDLLYERVIIEAKRYLVYSESTVAQVAHMTGFDDPAYFNRFFTRQVGMSPGAYRKQAAGASE